MTEGCAVVVVVARCCLVECGRSSDHFVPPTCDLKLCSAALNKLPPCKAPEIPQAPYCSRMGESSTSQGWCSEQPRVVPLWSSLRCGVRSPPTVVVVDRIFSDDLCGATSSSATPNCSPSTSAGSRSQQPRVALSSLSMPCGVRSECRPFCPLHRKQVQPPPSSRTNFAAPLRISSPPAKLKHFSSPSLRSRMGDSSGKESTGKVTRTVYAARGSFVMSKAEPRCGDGCKQGARTREQIYRMRSQPTVSRRRGCCDVPFVVV